MKIFFICQNMRILKFNIFLKMRIKQSFLNKLNLVDQ